MKLGKRGDTIIEVLMAIVVISATLGTAFATINSGVKGTRSSQERAEALKIVESQIELLKSARANSVSGLYGRSRAFCVNKTGSNITIHEAFNPPGSVGDAQAQPLTSYSNDCRNNSITGGYNYSIEEDASNVFVIRARWSSITGDRNDQIEIKYRMVPL